MQTIKVTDTNHKTEISWRSFGFLNHFDVQVEMVAKKSVTCLGLICVCRSNGIKSVTRREKARNKAGDKVCGLCRK